MHLSLKHRFNVTKNLLALEEHLLTYLLTRPS